MTREEKIKSAAQRYCLTIDISNILLIIIIALGVCDIDEQYDGTRKK